jgi:hypothetical protein
MSWSRPATLLLMLAAANVCRAQSTDPQQSAADKFEQYMRGDSSQKTSQTSTQQSGQQSNQQPGSVYSPSSTQQPGSVYGPPSSQQYGQSSTQRPAQRPAPRSAAPSDGHYRMRWAKLIDQTGFGQPTEAGSVLIPSDWKFDGRVTWAPTGCTSNLVTTSGRATSPDGLSGFEWLPTYAWIWTDDAQARQITMQAAAGQPASMRPCQMSQVVSPVDFIRSAILPQLRPNARIVSSGMLPELTRAAQAKMESDDAQYLQSRIFTGVRAQVGEVKITYQINGQPVEETIMAQIDVATQPQPSVAALSQGRMDNSSLYNVMAERVFAIRAPAGQMESRADLNATMLASLRQNAQWLSASQQIIMNVNGSQQQGIADRQRIMHDAQTQQGDAIIQHGQEMSVMQDRNAAEFSQAERDVEWYTDPNTNERMELSAGYAHSWTNSNGEVILNDDPNYNPSRVYQGNWTQLQRNR